VHAATLTTAGRWPPERVCLYSRLTLFSPASSSPSLQKVSSCTSCTAATRRLQVRASAVPLSRWAPLPHRSALGDCLRFRAPAPPAPRPARTPRSTPLCPAPRPSPPTQPPPGLPSGAISDHVIRGVRPVFPVGTPQPYAELAQACWAPCAAGVC
jgi:hypothetical protein